MLNNDECKSILQKEHKIKLILKGIFFLKLELIIQIKSLSQLHYSLLKLNSYKTTSFLGQKITLSINKIHRSLSTILSTNQRVLFKLHKIGCTQTDRNKFKKKIETSNIINPSKASSHKYSQILERNKSQTNSDTKIIQYNYSPQIQPSTLGQSIRQMAKSVINAIKYFQHSCEFIQKSQTVRVYKNMLKQIQDEVREQYLDIVSQKFWYVMKQINTKQNNYVQECFMILCNFRSNPSSIRCAKIYQILLNKQQIIRTYNYRRMDRFYLKGLGFAAFQNNMIHQRKRELDQFFVAFKLIQNWKTKFIKSFVQWKNTETSNYKLRAAKKLGLFLQLLELKLGQRKLIVFDQINRVSQIQRKKQYNILQNKLVLIVRQAFLTIPFYLIQHYQNNQYCSVKSNMSVQVSSQEVNIIMMTKILQRLVQRQLNLGLNNIKLSYKPQFLQIQNDLIANQSIISCHLSIHFNNLNDKYKMIRRKTIICKYVFQKLNYVQITFNQWKSKIPKYSLKDKVEILRKSIINESEKVQNTNYNLQNLLFRLEQLEIVNQDIAKRYNAQTSQNTPSNLYQQHDIDLNPVRGFEDLSKQDIEHDYTLDSLQQLENIENQNIHLKTKLNEQENLRIEMKTQFENRKKHLERILRNIRRGNQDFMSESPQKTSDFDEFILQSQDLYGGGK